MAFRITPDGRFLFQMYSIGDQFRILRMGEPERTEASPDGRIAWFEITRNFDHSMLVIDEDDAEQFDRLLQIHLCGQQSLAIFESHISICFDRAEPGEPDEF